MPFAHLREKYAHLSVAHSPILAVQLSQKPLRTADMETVIQIPLYRRRPNTSKQFLVIILGSLLAFVSVSAVASWLQPAWNWSTPLLLGGTASLCWLAIQYRDYFFPSPQATLVFAYGELRILQKEEVCFFVKTSELQAFLVEEGTIPMLYITAPHPLAVVRIVYAPGSTVLDTFPTADYLIYRQVYWLQLQQSLELSTSPTLPASTLSY